MIAAARELPTAELLRRGVLGLVALGIVGTSIELVFLGHWGSAARVIVWPALASLAIGLFLLVRAPSRTSIRAARAIAAAVGAVALIGVAFHVNENLAAGPLDRHFATTWDSLPAIRQWWLAVTGGVGPAPTLAPGVLLQLGLALLLATIRHPALGPAPARAPAVAAGNPAEGGTMSSEPRPNGAM